MLQCLNGDCTVGSVDGSPEPINRAKRGVMPSRADVVENADIVMLTFFNECVLLVAA